MTHKDDDPGQWLAAQFASKGEDAGTADDSPPTRRVSNDDSPTPDPAGAAPGESPRINQFGKNSLPLRRPVLPTGGGYTWGLTPGGGAGPDASVRAARPYSVPGPVAAVSTPASRPFFPDATPPAVANIAGVAADTQADEATGRTPESDNEHGLLPEPPASATVAPPSAASVSPEPAPALTTPSFTAPGFTAPGFSAPSFSAPTPSDPAPANAAPSEAIPTIQEVLDSPSPRRAAREAAAREAAAHAAAARSSGETSPQPPPAPAATAVRPPSPIIVPAEPAVPIESVAAASPIPATGFAASGGVAPSSNVDVPSGTTTAEMRALFGELSEETRAVPVPPDSREHPPAESAPADAPAVYEFNPNTQFFVDQSSSSQANAPRNSGEATNPASASTAMDWPKQASYQQPSSQKQAKQKQGKQKPSKQQQSDQTSKGPRNQRVVLFVLLGLVVVLGVVLAVNFVL